MQGPPPQLRETFPGGQTSVAMPQDHREEVLDHDEMDELDNSYDQEAVVDSELTPNEQQALYEEEMRRH